jgi:hypothetical protein
MTSDSSPISGRPSLITELERSGKLYPAVRLAPSGSGLHKTVGSPHTMPGRILDDSGKVRNWSWNGVLEHQGWLYLTFPSERDDAGGTLRPFESIFSASPSHVFRILKSFLRQISELSIEDDFEAGGYIVTSTFIDDLQRFHLLHPALGEILDRETVNEYLPAGLSGPRELVYRILRRIYFCLAHASNLSAGRTDTAVDTLAERPRIVHPRQSMPELRADIADTLFNALIMEQVPSLDEFREKITEWETRPPFENLNGRERTERLKEAENMSSRAARTIAVREFRRRYGTAVILSAIGLVILGFFIAPFIQRAMEPDITEGLEPAEVVRLFYESQNSLDHEAMQDCVIRDAGKSHLNQVTTLFVISRVRQGIEMKNVFLSASEWVAAGKPPLSDERFVFGVTDLRIRELLPDKSFEVEYIRWTTLPPEAADNLSDDEKSRVSSLEKVQAIRIRENIRMRETGRGWKIESIEEIGRTPAG